MNKALLYYLLSVLLAVLTAISYQLMVVFVVGQHDPKFGVWGTVQIAGFIACLCASVCFLSSAVWFLRKLKKGSVQCDTRGILLRSACNGLLIGLTYMPLLNHMPVIYGMADWPQYAVGFLLVGFVVAVLTNWLCLFFSKVRDD
jgi:hypothetical protein